MEGAQYDEIMALGDALGAIHFHDNRGDRDEHLIPLMGNMSIDEVMHALLDVGFKGPFTMEATLSFRPPKCYQGNRRTYEGDTRVEAPTLAMQKAIERVLFVTATEILTAYGLAEK